MTSHFLPTRTLEQVVTTQQLASRPQRKADFAAVEAAVLRLTRRMTLAPRDLLQVLAETTLEVCNAHTVGISILERDPVGESFKWRALAGRLAQARDLGMPRNPSPCGMVVDTCAHFLMSYPEQHFQFPGPVDPPIVEVLLTPFCHDGAPVGTIWIVAHDHERKFDQADLYAVSELARFASRAYSMLISLGYLQVNGPEPVADVRSETPASGPYPKGAH